MCSIGVANIQGVQAAGEEDGVFCEAVVQVVVYKLSQLSVKR